jgi:hypothetical protein
MRMGPVSHSRNPRCGTIMPHIQPLRQAKIDFFNRDTHAVDKIKGKT